MTKLKPVTKEKCLEQISIYLQDLEDFKDNPDMIKHIIIQLQMWVTTLEELL